MQKSTLTRALVYGGRASLMVLDTTALVTEAVRRHNLSNASASALGCVLTATAYLSAWLKDGTSTLSLTLKGDGECGIIHASGDGALRISGRVENPAAESFEKAIGQNGVLSVTRDEGEWVPVTGTVAFYCGDAEEIFKAYFRESEQRETEIALSVSFGKDGLRAGGIFIQPLPNAGKEIFERAKADVAACRACLQAEDVSAGTLAYFQTEGERTEFGFRCRCSRERAERAIVSLGRAEAEKMLTETDAITVHCDECNTDYIFDKACTNALFGDKT